VDPTPGCDPQFRASRDGSKKAYKVRAESVKAFDVMLVDGLFDPQTHVIADLLRRRRSILVTTPTVARLYGDKLLGYVQGHGLDCSLMILTCGEASKDLGLAARVCEFALDHGCDRRAVLVGMGGGVCTDIVTVAASWIRRGIGHIRIPTTLVGQIDAGIGVKGAVNFRGKKSFLGCFHPPKAVVIDPALLQSLPEPQVRCGIAEMIKIALVRDAKLFGLVEKHGPRFVATRFARPPAEAREALWLSIVRMLQELQPNLYEDKTYKRFVDLGHTFSPLLEAASRFRIAHGEAVAIDTALSAVISRALGLLPEVHLRRILSSIAAVGLPIYSAHLNLALCRTALEESARHRGGTPNLVLPLSVGNATFLEEVDGIPIPVLEGAIRRLARESEETELNTTTPERAPR
jgi:3-dehydroquinate synthase